MWKRFATLAAIRHALSPVRASTRSPDKRESKRFRHRKRERMVKNRSLEADARLGYGYFFANSAAI
jgi:hypothetical protein